MSFYVLPVGLLTLGAVVITVMSALFCVRCDHPSRRSDQAIILSGIVIFLTMLDWITAKQYDYSNDVRNLFYIVVFTVWEYQLFLNVLRRRKILCTHQS